MPVEPINPLEPSEIFKATVRGMESAKAMYDQGYRDGKLRGRAEAFAEMRGPLTELAADIAKVCGNAKAVQS